ncbi:amino acid permease-domain-containing protein [Lentinula aciculospora]|uniref:Amino acid permease-domain-containing protein n=1 Tax=Lentinula aciculospora TaxID=153920 RepID=A0A9W9AJ20_9AGAR|nr:amino acid permease-domain-containing protein [Lentinula aciculospora]
MSQEDCRKFGPDYSNYGATTSGGTSQEVEDGTIMNNVNTGLHRGLSARQVQMIAIAGTIGTGLFLGTGKSLAEGGPASILICYAIVGFIVYVTLLLLGEMATQYPVAGSFNAYTTRFFSPSYGFALSWNYWFNDAVSVASDLTAAQLVLHFWVVQHSWIVSLVFWVFLVSINAIHVRAYGELEYWLSSLKVIAIIIFIILGVLVNVGVNQEHQYIGARYWHIPGAPFVRGFGGFAQVFVTASFAYGGTESLGITAGETRNPSRNMPRVVKFVFWRILLFYLLSILLIGLNVPWDYPNLSNKTTTTSPFTLVFQQAGSTVAASFMNTVILTSVLSAGNHALFAGTRVLYGLSVTSPRQAPAIFSWTSSNGVPIPALLLTSSVSALCFGSSFIGSGTLWGWLQNIVGVSNQIAWFSIGLASRRFRKAWLAQGRSLDELKFRPKWTWPWGPPFVVATVAAIIIVQGWSSIIPKFSPIDFVSYYIEIPIMLVMYIAWAFINCPRRPSRTTGPINESTSETSGSRNPRSPSQTPLFDESVRRSSSKRRREKAGKRWYNDIVDVQVVDLYQDEHEEEEEDRVDDGERERRLKGSSSVKRTLWRLFYLIA